MSGTFKGLEASSNELRVTERLHESNRTHNIGVASAGAGDSVHTVPAFDSSGSSLGVIFKVPKKSSDMFEVHTTRQLSGRFV